MASNLLPLNGSVASLLLINWTELNVLCLGTISWVRQLTRYLFTFIKYFCGGLCIVSYFLYACLVFVRIKVMFAFLTVSRTIIKIMEKWVSQNAEFLFCKMKRLVESDQIRSDQSLSRVRLFATPRIAARQASLSITNSWSSLRLTSVESVMPSSHLILCRPLVLLPPIPPSISLFQWVNSSHEVARVLEFQL